MIILQPAPSLASQLPQGLHCTHYLWEPAAGDDDPATCPTPGLHCTSSLWEPACRRCLPCNPPHPWPALHCTAPNICGSRLAGDADSATCPIPGLRCTRYLWEPTAGDADPAICPIAGKPAPTKPALHPIPVGAGLPAMLTLQPAPSLACAALKSRTQKNAPDRKAGGVFYSAK